MTDTTPNLALPELIAAQAQKHVTVNEALRALDALVQLAVLDRDLASPPAEPTEGARWIVASGASDAWTGHDDEIAAWQDGGWSFYPPQIGWLSYVVDDGALVAWTGSAWADAIFTPASLNNMVLLGVGTTADETNPFGAKLNNALWVAKSVAEGGDGTLRYKMSKESADKTLSVLFQDDFSGRAEIGLTGDDDFHFKVSPDGSAWHDAITIDRASGRLSFPVMGGPRDTLTADRTYYVRTDGDDGNDGLADTTGGAWLTLQHAADVIFGTLDLGGHDVTVAVADGSYAEGVLVVGAQVGAGRIYFVGNAGTPGNVVVTSATGYAFTAEAGAFFTVESMELQSTSRGCLQATRGGVIYFSNLRIGTIASGQHQIRADDQGLIFAEGDYDIVGSGGNSHWNTVGSGVIRVQAKTITITGTPSFGVAFAWASTLSSMFINGNTLSGSTTGKRYLVEQNSVLLTGGVSTYLPGSLAGIAQTGGLYV